MKGQSSISKGDLVVWRDIICKVISVWKHHAEIEDANLTVHPVGLSEIVPYQE